MPEDRKPCEGCGVEVWWVKHERTGNPAPLVRAPETMPANIMVYKPDGDSEFVYRLRKKFELPNMFAYINHFADCPKAAQFKGR